MAPVLDFNNYERLLEAEEKNEGVLLASQIMLTFFDVYSAILPLADGYDKIERDLTSLIEDKGSESMATLEEKSKDMITMIDSVVAAVNDKGYESVVPKLKKAAQMVIGSYDSLIGQYDEEDKEDIRQIKNAVSKSAVRFMSNLKETKKKSPELKESLRHELGDAVFEAIKHRKEREELQQQLIATKALLDDYMNTRGMTALLPTLNKLVDELVDLMKKVNSNDHWEGRKRKDRQEELEQISARVIEIPKELTQQNIKLIRTFGSNKNAVAELEAAKKALDSARGELAKLNKEEIVKVEPEKGEDKEAGGEKEYENIDPDDIENQRKAGKNRGKIEDYQRAANEILKDVEGYSKIKEDGLYGKNTKKAIAEVQEVMNKLGAGLNTEGSLTAQTQKVMDNFMKRKNDIIDLLKSEDKEV